MSTEDFWRNFKCHLRYCNVLKGPPTETYMNDYSNTFLSIYSHA